LRIIAAHPSAIAAQITLLAVVSFAVANQVFALTVITFKFDHKESISSLSLLSHYQSWEEKKELKKFFDEAKVNGCFLLYDLQAEKYIGYNLKRAKKPFLPASTFKILNSIIALETGVVKNENEIIKWDGMKRQFEVWNKDYSMKDAFAASTVWFYQEIARRIGHDKMQKFVNSAKYGNQNINGGIDQFWLTGDLRISAKEEIDFLVKFHKYKLPFSRKTINTVKEISINEKTDKYILRAKTGWAFEAKLGWWVGYIERDHGVYFFALNIDIAKDEDAAKRIPLTKSILRELRIIE